MIAPHSPLPSTNLSPYESFLDLFDENVRAHPDAPSLIWDGSSVSYGELSQRSMDLALRIAEHGVNKGDIVALCLPRSPRVIECMLAIMRVGGVFVSIDPLYPAARREFMLSDCQPKLLIQNMDLEEDLPSQQKLSFSPHSTSSSRASHLANVYSRETSNPAYIVYTSGTTGKPKGAVNTHAALLNLAREQIRVLDLHPGDRVLQFASYSFDASISEVVMALGAGATLVLPQSYEVLPGPSLVACLQENEISHVTLPPSILGTLPRVPFPDLKAVLVAGEPCPVDLAHFWAEGRRFYNGYGVSEASVCSAMYEFDAKINSVPIGKPLSGVEFLVFDENDHPVSVGEVGELLIGGIGVGLGYLGLPDLTKDRFVERTGVGGNPVRFYRSGDLVRPVLGGLYEYVARKDNQVKIRGFRIELEEVALAIEKISEVQECVVVVREDPSGSKQLSAFLTLHPSVEFKNDTGLPSGIRRELERTLPMYMVPSHINILPDFPRTVNGKIDLKKLASHSLGGEFHDTSGEEKSEVEQLLVQLCKELIGIERISLDLSFLDLGGDSLQAAQLAWQLESQLSIRMSEADILEAPSLRAIANQLSSNSQDQLPELRVLERTGPVKPIPSQAIFGVLEQMGVDSSSLNCCAAFELTGTVEVSALQHAYEKLFQRHEGLRLRFQITPENFGLTTFESVHPTLEIVDLREESNQAELLDQLFSKAERICFDMQRDLLFRSWLVQLSDDRSLFVLVAHHAVFDAWSLNIMLQDWLALAAEELRGTKRVETLPIQYLDFVPWFHQVLQLRDQEATNRYFSQVFSKPLPKFDLKGVKPRPEFKSRIGQNLFLSLSRESVAQIKRFCERERTTPFMFCTSLLKSILFLHSDQPEILVGGPVSLRYHRDLDRQIGLYGASYVLRTGFSQNEDFRSLLARIQKNLVESYRYLVHDILDVVQRFEIEMDMSRTPPFDVSIASHLIDMELCHPAVRKDLQIDIRPYRFPLTTSFFDFEFTFHTFQGEIELETRYDAALYDHTQIEALHQSFRSLLPRVLNDPSLTLRKMAAQL